MDRKLLTDFKEKRDTYLKLETLAAGKIEELIRDRGFFVMDVTHRTKEVGSLEGKLHRKGDLYNSIYDVTDLVGCRIICYFSDDVDAISNAMSDIFDVDALKTHDKRKQLEATSFGYMSMHIICAIKAEDDPEQLFNGIQFEIQIRSVLQHAWAEIEHDLGYKSDYGLPRAVRRSFSRTASLLEVADEAFVALRQSARGYTRSVRKKIAEDKAEDILLDRVSLRSFINESKSFRNYVDICRESFGCEITGGYIDGYLPQLQYLEVKTLGDLMQMIEGSRELSLSIIGNYIHEYGIDIISNTMIIRCICLAYMVMHQYPDDRIETFLLLGNIAPDTVKRRMKQISALRDKYNKEGGLYVIS